jgi:glycerophosphoryl diester phosphodiesterase
MTGRPLVLAHRGACRQAPENTVAAFTRARELGADGVELDVRRTRDGALVVSHDPRVAGAGVLIEHSLAELRAAAPSVPTLDEAFDALDGMLVNVEIKGFPTEPDADPERLVARGVVDLVDRRALHDRVIVSSFELDCVDAVHALDGRVATAWLTMNLAPSTSLPIAVERGHAWVHPDRASMLGAVATDTMRAAKELGRRIDVWTVDDPDEMRALAAAGVDAIMTNVPDVARSVLDGR